MQKLTRYWLIVLVGTVIVSLYPIYMGLRVIYDMIISGTVLEENFPKYIIPYTPIAIAVIVAVLIMPLVLSCIKKYVTLFVSVFSILVFFVAELLFESKVIVTSTVTTTLESWQMFMCYVPPQGYGTRTWKAIDVLIGEYSPTFKIHFYLISVVLIIAIINCLYGYARMLQTGEKGRRKVLAVQSVCTVFFLGLCIFACFTAFFRDGELTVSALSAFLMCLFFVVLGVTVGTYVGSFVLGRGKAISVVVPSLAAILVTLAMYIGEMFLLSGHLYKLGTGFFFEAIPGIVLAPMDILVILVSGLLTAVICVYLNGNFRIRECDAV